MHSLSVSSDRAPCSLFRAEMEVGELPARPRAGPVSLPRVPGCREEGPGQRVERPWSTKGAPWGRAVGGVPWAPR